MKNLKLPLFLAISIAILFSAGFAAGYFANTFHPKPPEKSEAPVLSSYNGVSPDYIQVVQDTTQKKKTEDLVQVEPKKTGKRRPSNSKVSGWVGYYTVMEAIVPRGDSIYHWYNSGDQYRYAITSQNEVLCPGGNIWTIRCDTLTFEIERSLDHYILSTPSFFRQDAHQFHWKGDTIQLGIQSWPVIYRQKGKAYTPFD